ncbi:remorin 4.1-like isoform X2 [Asparagus officinalis]|uniref:remorin 4.1-like isoform X2 n=1 Tax=Asparagus officinalis TaxID=4686 RepID=UPI00098E80C0|nr:remorin 4.1-like isoform X2 [Asparagus officinalis]
MMRQTDIFSDGEFEALIAAAAYAITLLEEKDGPQKQRGSVKFSEETLPKAKSRNEDAKVKLNSFRGSFKKWFSDQGAKEDEKPGGSKRSDSGKETRPSLPRAPSAKILPTSSFGRRTQGEYSPDKNKTEDEADAWERENNAQEEADAWEKEQMIKIRKRFDKMMSMIVEWENEKKAKAKSRLERKENEPEQTRAKALQKYENEISRIEKVAGDARALAEERKRNDETKARAKAEKIRSTGKMPRACCCC